MGACGSTAATARSADLDGLTYKKQYTGQVAPPQPTRAEVRDRKTSSGPLLVVGGTSVQRGAFNSLWVRPLGPGVKMSALLRSAAQAEASLERSNQAQYGAAVYVCVAEAAAAVSHPHPASCVRREPRTRHDESAQ